MDMWIGDHSVVTPSLSLGPNILHSCEARDNLVNDGLAGNSQFWSRNKIGTSLERLTLMARIQYLNDWGLYHTFKILQRPSRDRDPTDITELSPNSKWCQDIWVFSSILLSSVTPISLFAVHSRAMGVPLEPGQKGVNWSNIAVGELVMSRLYSLCTDANARWYHEYGNLTTSPKNDTRMVLTVVSSPM